MKTAKNIIGLLLLITSVFFSFKHGWDAFQIPDPIVTARRASLGINIHQDYMPYFGVFSIIVGLMLLIPKTFVLGNILQVLIILLIIGLAINAGLYMMILIEIPFLAMPLILIWLKYPFKN